MKLSAVAALYHPQHILVYGDPSVGKSTLVSKLAEAGYSLKWLSLDNGHHILQKLSPAAQERVELYNIPDTRGYPVGVDTLRVLLDRKNLHICDLHGKQDCGPCKAATKTFSDLDLTTLTKQDIIVIDNLSQFSASVQSLVVKDKAIDYKLQLDDWGALKFHLEKYLTDIQQYPFNIVCIAHAVEEEMVDKTKKIMPAVGSSTFAPKVGGFFDHVIYCNIQGGSHKFGSKSTYRPAIITKSRSDVVIETMAEASLVPFFDGTIKPVAATEAPKAAAATTVALGSAVERALALARGQAGKLPEVKKA